MPVIKKIKKNKKKDTNDTNCALRFLMQVLSIQLTAYLRSWII